MDLLRDAKARIREVAVHEIGKHDDLIVLDVRDPHEFAQGHIAGAHNVSRGMLEFAVENTLPDKSAAVLVCCGTGGRSALAADVMQQLGYQDVASLAGGIKAWQEAGLAVNKK